MTTQKPKKTIHVGEDQTTSPNKKKKHKARILSKDEVRNVFLQDIEDLKTKYKDRPNGCPGNEPPCTLPEGHSQGKHCFGCLKRAVLERSTVQKRTGKWRHLEMWQEAVNQFEFYSSLRVDSSCVCGVRVSEEHYIRNKINGEWLVVGSTCVKRFMNPSVCDNISCLKCKAIIEGIQNVFFVDKDAAWCRSCVMNEPCNYCSIKGEVARFTEDTHLEIGPGYKYVGVLCLKCDRLLRGGDDDDDEESEPKQPKKFCFDHHHAYFDGRKCPECVSPIAAERRTELGEGFRRRELEKRRRNDNQRKKNVRYGLRGTEAESGDASEEEEEGELDDMKDFIVDDDDEEEEEEWELELGADTPDEGIQGESHESQDNDGALSLLRYNEARLQEEIAQQELSESLKVSSQQEEEPVAPDSEVGSSSNSAESNNVDSVQGESELQVTQEESPLQEEPVVIEEKEVRQQVLESSPRRSIKRKLSQESPSNMDERLEALRKQKDKEIFDLFQMEEDNKEITMNKEMERELCVLRKKLHEDAKREFEKLVEKFKEERAEVCARVRERCQRESEWRQKYLEEHR